MPLGMGAPFSHSQGGRLLSQEGQLCKSSELHTEMGLCHNVSRSFDACLVSMPRLVQSVAQGVVQQCGVHSGLPVHTEYNGVRSVQAETMSTLSCLCESEPVDLGIPQEWESTCVFFFIIWIILESSFSIGSGRKHQVYKENLNHVLALLWSLPFCRDRRLNLL